MAQLKYAAGKLAWRAATSIAFIPAFLYLALDERIATGHVRGVWVTLLYELGPLGRWVIVASLAGILLYLCGRMLVILAGDQVALRADETGIFVRTASGHREIAWPDVLTIDILTKAVRGKTYHWVRVRELVGVTERSWQVPTSLLEASSGEIAVWLSDAQQARIRANEPHLSPTVPTIVPVFGRKRGLVAR